MTLVGQTIGNYKVVQQIGEGGMGVVYLAEHPVIGRKVAIKLLHHNFARDTETVARFFNEARAIHMIAHPNIVEILDFGQTSDGQPYFIMEFLSGQSLADRVAAGPMPPADAVAIVSQICDALQAAHNKNVIHRDLKPHNVYLVGAMTKPTVKILDFGVAKLTTGWNSADSGGQSVKTRTGSLMGTPLYMSPEQCRGSGKLDHRTDIYSLAVILFEMISGHPPFMAEGIGELFAKHMLEPAPSLAEAVPNTPPAVARAVARALAKDLEHRFESMNAFRDALNGKLDVAAPPVSGAAKARVATVQATLSGTQSIVASRRSVEDVTTLSSAASELGDDALAVPQRSRKGIVIGLALAAAVAGTAVFLLRQNHPAEPAAPPTAHDPTPPQPPVQPPAEPETVMLRFEAEPETAHVFRKTEATPDGEDLGVVPVELKLPKGDATATYVLRADGFRDRATKADATRDRVVHLALEKVPSQPAPSEKKPPAAKPPGHGGKPRKPVVHDGDGLAVPSF
ncbi:MAG TPA: serine/threonine-protein kinase [Polyangia bacterium]|nr:serine/threonine-protein kinase [Polyangia bacterium]